MTISVDELAQEIRRVDGRHDLGAGALAEALMPFIAARLREPAGVGGEWVLVPRVPTGTMLQAGVNAGVAARGPWCPKVWTAMLAATPQPPAEAQAQGGGECQMSWQPKGMHEKIWTCRRCGQSVTRDGSAGHPFVPCAAPPSAPVGVEGFVEWYASVDARLWNNWDACNAAFHAGKRAALAQQPAAVDGVMRKVAALAHSGGLLNMSEGDALTAIRRLTSSHWQKEEKAEQVVATLAAQPGGSDNVR